jgi:hypothetical protein
MSPLVRRLFLCACAAAGFAGMAALLHRALPPPHVPEVTPKLDFLAAHRGDFDTVFIGSSRIYHGISPKAFDAATAAAGKPTHSFNLAINGMMPPESLHMLRTFLAMRPGRLRTVFLEVASAEPNADTTNLTIRDIYAQDSASLLYGCKRALLDLRTAPKDRWQRAWDDLSASAVTFAQNELNIGRLDLTADLTKIPDRLGGVMLGPDTDGYLPVHAPIVGDARVAFEKNLDAIRSGKVPARPADPLNIEEYARTRDLLAARGVELVLVVTPLTLKDYHPWVDAPPGPRLLKFDDPGRYPELYLPEHRHDSEHLNDAGAQIFSRELAEAYLAAQ